MIREIDFRSIFHSLEIDFSSTWTILSHSAKPKIWLFSLGGPSLWTTLFTIIFSQMIVFWSKSSFNWTVGHAAMFHAGWKSRMMIDSVWYSIEGGYRNRFFIVSKSIFCRFHFPRASSPKSEFFLERSLSLNYSFYYQNFQIDGNLITFNLRIEGRRKSLSFWQCLSFNDSIRMMMCSHFSNHGVLYSFEGDQRNRFSVDFS